MPYTICFIRRGDEVLLLNRRSAPWMGCWNGVGGKLEPGETPAANIVREIREETGLELKQSEVVWKGIVTWTVDGGRLGGMHVFVANLPGHLALETPKQTEEGILDWKRIDWITDPANQGVASNVPRFLTTLFEDASEWEHRCVFEAGRLTGYERLPLGVDLRTVRRGNG
ncbi:8-oxo-dGTP diphosphatase [Paenibacillus thermoaerophilus]|nr:8-oxo-dGTP diphosphatase [Paenibacillus thermoaerophilus]